MDVKLIKTNTNKKLLQNLFNNMSQTITKDEIQQLVFTDSLRRRNSTVQNIIITME